MKNLTQHFTIFLMIISSSVFGQNWIEEASFGGEPHEECGTSVAMSSDGKTMIVGCESNYYGRGRIKVYTKVGQNWIRKGKDITGLSNVDKFGASVAISGDGSVIAVGADGAWAGDTVKYVGEVFVYKWLNNSWTNLGQVIQGECENCRLGSVIDISNDGNLLAIGESRYKEQGSVIGRLSVYRLEGEQWVNDQTFKGNAYNERFGYSCDISGNGEYLAIGSYNYIDSSSIGVGRVVTYKRTNDTWILNGQNLLSPDSFGTYFGYSVSINEDGNSLIVGAPFTGPTKDGRAEGAAYIYKLENSIWKLEDDAIRGLAGDFLGSAVRINPNGNVVAIGVPGNLFSSGEAGRRVEIYQKFGEQWDSVEAYSADINFKSGSIDFSKDGSYLCIGSTEKNYAYEDRDSGYVKIYHNQSLGIRDVDLSTLKIYPNPVKGLLNIDFRSLNQNTLIELFDLNGHLIKSQISSKSNLVWDMNGYKGFYFIKITSSDGQIINQKIVVL